MIYNKSPENNFFFELNPSFQRYAPIPLVSLSLTEFPVRLAGKFSDIKALQWTAPKIDETTLNHLKCLQVIKGSLSTLQSKDQDVLEPFFVPGAFDQIFSESFGNLLFLFSGAVPQNYFDFIVN